MNVGIPTMLRVRETLPLADGSTQCNCADWTYQIAETNRARTSRCKHLDALAALGWI